MSDDERPKSQLKKYLSNSALSLRTLRLKKDRRQKLEDRSFQFDR